MDNNEVFKAGKRVSFIESEIEEAIQKSLWYVVNVPRVIGGEYVNSFGDAQEDLYPLMIFEYRNQGPSEREKAVKANIEDFLQRAKNYNAYLDSINTEYNSIKEKFPDLDHFNSSAPFGVLLNHGIAVQNLEQSIGKLSGVESQNEKT
ncbi:hypothetical protein ACFL1H_04530 [Nanoarchaeota archaeon]